MSTSTSHVSGTIAVVNGSTTVTGVGSLWYAARLRAGDLFCANGLSVAIASITNNTTMVLAEPWPGTTIAPGGIYSVRYVFDGERGLSTLNDVLTKINLTSDYSDEAAASADAAALSATDANTSKVAAETAKTDSETARDASIAAKVLSETAAGTATTKAGEASSSATDSNTAKVASEGARDTALAHRNDAQAAKTGSETARDASISAKDASIAAQTASETARDASITAKDASVTAKDASVAAQTASETARDASVTAKDASVAAKVASEGARDASIAAKVTAEGARDTALNHRNDAQAAKTDSEAARDISISKAAEAAASAASISSGPVTSVATKTGIVTLADLSAAGVALTSDLAGKQASSTLLTNISALTLAADNLIYSTGATTVAATPITTQARQLLDDTSFAAMLTTLGAAAASHSHATSDITGLDTALADKAALAGATFTGPVNVTTQSATDNSTLAASTAYVKAVVANLIASAPTLLDTLDEIAAALGDDPNFAATMTTALSNKQPLDANVTSINSRVYSAGQMIYWTADEVTATLSTTAYGRSLLNAADASALRTLVVAQLASAVLDAVAALTMTNDNFLQIKGGAISGRTVAEVITDLIAGNLLDSRTLNTPTIANGYIEETYAFNASGTTAIDLTNGSAQAPTLVGNWTPTFPTAGAGKGFSLLIRQNGTGGYTITWPSVAKFPGGIAPTITATASKADKVSFQCFDGTNWIAVVNGQNYA